MRFILYDVGIHILPPSVWEEDSPELIWPSVLVMLILWWMTYWALLKLTKKQPEYCCRVLTLLHGLLSTYLTLREIIVNKRKLDEDHDTALTPMQTYFLTVTFSYFLYDSMWIIFFGSEPLTIHLHHACSLSLLLKIILSNTGGPVISYGLLGLEITNPCLQARWFLRTHGFNNTAIHKWVELWFIFSFLAIRAIGGTILFHYVVTHSNLDVSLKLAFLGIYIISCLMIVQVFRFFKRKYWLDAQQLMHSISVFSIYPFRSRGSLQPSQTPRVEDEQPGES